MQAPRFTLPPISMGTPSSTLSSSSFITPPSPNTSLSSSPPRLPVLDTTTKQFLIFLDAECVYCFLNENQKCAGSGCPGHYLETGAAEWVDKMGIYDPTTRVAFKLAFFAYTEPVSYTMIFKELKIRAPETLDRLKGWALGMGSNGNQNVFSLVDTVLQKTCAMH